MNLLRDAFLIGVVVAGSVFALQGLRVLPSVVMYGRAEWIVIGGLMIAIGLGGLVLSRR